MKSGWQRWLAGWRGGEGVRRVGWGKVGLGVVIMGVGFWLGVSWLDPAPRWQGRDAAGYRDLLRTRREVVVEAFAAADERAVGFLADAAVVGPSSRDRVVVLANRVAGVFRAVLPRAMLMRMPLPWNSHEEIRGYALGALERLGPEAAGAVGALVVLLEGKDEFLRVKSLRVLGRMGERARVAMPVLMRLTLHPDAWTRGTALDLLGQLDPRDPGVRAVAGRCLADTNPGVRLQAAHLLWSSEGRAGRLVPTLVELMSSADGPIRLRALTLVGLFGRDAGPAVPAITNLLGHEDVQTRLAAATVLSGLGDLGRLGLPGLEVLRDDPDPRVRVRAVRSIQLLDGPARVQR